MNLPSIKGQKVSFSASAWFPTPMKNAYSLFVEMRVRRKQDTLALIVIELDLLFPEAMLFTPGNPVETVLWQI